MRYAAFASWLLVWTVPGALPLAAQNGNGAPHVSATRLTAEPSGTAIFLDGILEESAWAQATVAGDFKQREPLEGRPATERTDVRVLYDNETLYIGVMAYDREPDLIISRILQRDRVMQAGGGGGGAGSPQFTGDDAVAILLDPFHDHRNGMVFATNPNGAEFEALITDEGREFNVDWRAVWRVAAAKHAHGWSAEFAIPFRSLRYPSGRSGEPWGFNVYRVIRRKNEEVLWAAWSRDNEGFERVSRAGHVDGLRDLPRPTLNLELKPFVLSGGTQEGVDGAATALDGKVDAGLDLKYEVRPGLVLDLTANTDFAQVEVDDQQVNLTRFDLFFPEKRDFFLENSGIFEFGTRGRGRETPPFLLFFSRSIGLDEDGEVPMLGGARLTGRVGGQTVGLLNAVTDGVNGGPRANFAVARVKRDFGESSYVGLALTDHRAGDSTNTVGGVDFSFWPTKQLNLQAFVARTQTNGPGGDDNAYSLALEYGSDFWNIQASHRFIGPETNADIGFITRADIRNSAWSVRANPRPRFLGLRRLSVFNNSNYQTRTDGVLQDWRSALGTSWNWNSGERLVVFYARGFTRLDEAFDLADEVTVPAGDYDIWELGWFGNTSDNRSLVLGVNGSYQRFFDGRLFRLGGETTLQAGAHLGLTLGLTHNNVDIPFGSFEANIASLRLNLAASTKFVTNALFQYNSLTNNLSANVRLNFIHRPGSDLFVVFTEQRGSEQSVWDFENRGIVAKLTYLSRL